MSREGLVVAPGTLPDDAGDILYAQTLAAIGRAIDGCGKSSEKVTLLLSTCRNEFLTTNAIFVDLSQVLGSGTKPSPLESAIAHLRDGRPGGARKSLAIARQTLAQIPQKLETWDERIALLETYGESLNGLAPSDRAWARAATASVIQPESRRGVPWDGAYLKMSTAVDSCGPHLETLSWASRRVSNAIGLLEILSTATGPHGTWETQLDMRLDPTDASSELETNGGPELVLQQLRKHRETWQVSEVARGTEVVLATAPPGVLGAEANQPPETHFLPLEGGAALFATTVHIAEEAIESVKERLRGTFRPNVEHKPLPAPFVIDLSTPHVDPRTAAAFAVLRPQFAPGGTHPDRVRVAVLGATIPEHWYVHGNHYCYDTTGEGADRVVAAVEAAIGIARTNGVSVVVVPEYFIPRTALARVLDAATAAGVALIGGVEARAEPDGRTVNEVVVQFPGHVRINTRKQRPSIVEPGPHMFASDGRLLVCRDTVLGDVAIVVCSDFLEADLMVALTQATGKQVHSIVVCTRNPRTDRFRELAIADATRLYANVLIANSELGGQTDFSGDSEGVAHAAKGCLYAAPWGETGLQPPESHFGEVGPSGGGFECSMLVWDVDMKAIRARIHKNPDRNKWKVPYYVSEGL